MSAVFVISHQQTKTLFVSIEDVINQLLFNISIINSSQPSDKHSTNEIWL